MSVMSWGVSRCCGHCAPKLSRLRRVTSIPARNAFEKYRDTPPNVSRDSFGVGKRGLLEKGSFQKSPFSRDSREFRDSRVSRVLPDCGKERRIRPFSRDSREFRDFRDSRDSSSEKTPFVLTPFSGPEDLLQKNALFLVESSIYITRAEVL